MTVDVIAWAAGQSLPDDQRSILTLMALLAAEAGTGVLYLGNLIAVAVRILLPLVQVQAIVEALTALGLVLKVSQGYRLQAGVQLP